MSENYLPKDYEPPKGESRFLRLEEGSNVIRALSKPVLGWEWWVDKDGKRNPVRVRTEEEIPNKVKKFVTGTNRPKHFWAVVVWNYDRKLLQVWQFNQKTIIDGLFKLINDKAWGSLLDYDVVVNKTKTGSRDRDVSYSVTPHPKTELDEKLKAEFIAAQNLNLGRLFEGKSLFDEEGEVSDSDLGESAKKVKQ